MVWGSATGNDQVTTLICEINSAEVNSRQTSRFIDCKKWSMSPLILAIGLRRSNVGTCDNSHGDSLVWLPWQFRRLISTTDRLRLHTPIRLFWIKQLGILVMPCGLLIYVACVVLHDQCNVSCSWLLRSIWTSLRVRAKSFEICAWSEVEEKRLRIHRLICLF